MGQTGATLAERRMAHEAETQNGKGAGGMPEAR